MCPVKEPNFFSATPIKKHKLFYPQKPIDSQRKYEQLFANVDGQEVIGEASVSYLFYSEVPHSIYEYNQEAKIIIMLRNPVDRAFSHYSMDRRLGYVDKKITLRQIFDQGNDDDNLKAYYHQYLLLGLYTDQVERYMNRFPGQVMIIYFEEFVTKTESTVREVLDFLGVNSDVALDAEDIHNQQVFWGEGLIQRIYVLSNMRKLMRRVLPEAAVRRLKMALNKTNEKPKIDDQLSSHLTDFYKSDIKKLETLLDVDLNEWYK